MGEVYKAQDARLRRSVALKVLAVDGDGNEEAAAHERNDRALRMLHEARAAAALEHPNVVAIYDVGQVSEPEALRGTPYIAMELVQGRPLRAYVGDARVPLTIKLRWLGDVARAHAAAHDAGLVHRDVKPENVMIRDDGVVKVLDFGIAKRLGGESVDPTSSTERYAVSTSAHGKVRGTPLYIAPERLRGEALDGRVDQFAWGVVAYELLTGRPPWWSDGIALVSQILRTPPRPFEERDAIPAEIASVVMRALAKAREERFPTMSGLLEALEGLPSEVNDKRISWPPPALRAADVTRDDAVAVGDGGHAKPTTAAGPRASPRQAPRFAGRAAWALVSGLVALLAAFLAVEHRFAERQRATIAARRADERPPAGCTENRACSAQNGGRPYLCRASDHACVAVDSEDCKASYEPGDLERDDTVWLGAMFPLKGAQAERFGKMNMDGAEFARSELARAVEPLQDPNAPRHVRPVALVECDDSENAVRAAHHLVDDVGVPGILGFRSGDELTSLATSLLLERGVVSVASLTHSPVVTRLAQPANEPRLVWRTTYGYDALAEATAAIVRDVLDARRHGPGETHLVLVRDAAPSAGPFAETFYRDLSFNGKPALDNGDAYQEIFLPASWDGALDAAADRIAAVDPSVVIYLLSLSPLALTERVETRAKRRPIYVLPNNGTTLLAPFVGANADRRRRVFSIQSVSNSMPNARFVIRYNEERGAHVTRVANPSVTYDAFYALAYASFSVPPSGHVDGVTLADRFSRLVGPGKAVEVGPSGIFDALTILSSGGTINLEGAAGALDFDLKTGETSEDFALFCPEADAQGRDDGDDVESGVFYRTKAHRIEGAFTCR